MLVDVELGVVDPYRSVEIKSAVSQLDTQFGHPIDADSRFSRKLSKVYPPGIVEVSSTRACTHSSLATRFQCQQAGVEPIESIHSYRTTFTGSCDQPENSMHSRGACYGRLHLSRRDARTDALPTP